MIFGSDKKGIWFVFWGRRKWHLYIKSVFKNLMERGLFSGRW